jgi:hypothetical protein
VYYCNEGAAGVCHDDFAWLSDAETSVALEAMFLTRMNQLLDDSRTSDDVKDRKQLAADRARGGAVGSLVSLTDPRWTHSLFFPCFFFFFFSNLRSAGGAGEAFDPVPDPLGL